MCVENWRAVAAREGKEKPFGGAAADESHDQPRQRSSTDLDVTDPLSNQIPDSLKGYLDNISATATHAVANGGPLAELSTSLAISVDTVSAQ